MRTLTTAVLASALLTAGCGQAPDGGPAATFGEDLAFLKKHTDAVVLSDAAGQAQVVVVPQYQGRVMTSTSAGAKGASYGWINRELIASGKLTEHMNVFGGEDRLWFGPEGGQFAVFFKEGDPFDLEHWQTPPVVDSERWEVAEKTAESVSFSRKCRLVNYSGKVFRFRINRSVRLLGAAKVREALGVAAPAGVRTVAFQSESKLTNTARRQWKKRRGLLSLWILGQFNCSPRTTIVIPFKPGSDAELGPTLNPYPSFGKLLPERIKIKGGVVYFRGDGRRRNKIGLFSRRAKGVCGSYDAANNLLTIVKFNQPAGPKDYVNSAWTIQETPYVGDAISSYNDGPPEPGKKGLGAFYELESLSAAEELKPRGSILHVHSTFHLEGPRAKLDGIARATLGVGLDEIEAALPRLP